MGHSDLMPRKEQASPYIVSVFRGYATFDRRQEVLKRLYLLYNLYYNLLI